MKIRRALLILLPFAPIPGIAQQTVILPSLNADGGALSHVTNLPTSFIPSCFGPDRSLNGQGLCSLSQQFQVRRSTLLIGTSWRADRDVPARIWHWRELRSGDDGAHRGISRNGSVRSGWSGPPLRSFGQRAMHRDHGRRCVARLRRLCATVISCVSMPLRLRAGPTIFLQKLAKRGGIQHLLGQKLLQLRVLVLELLQPFGLGHIHAAVLGLPVVSVASETPCLRARSAVFAPASCSFKIPMI